MNNYTLEIGCYKDGMFKDGGTYGPIKSDNDEDAKFELLGKIQVLYRYYDRINWILRKNNKEVLRYE